MKSWPQWGITTCIWRVVMVMKRMDNTSLK